MRLQLSSCPAGIAVAQAQHALEMVDKLKNDIKVTCTIHPVAGRMLVT